MIYRVIITFMILEPTRASRWFPAMRWNSYSIETTFDRPMEELTLQGIQLAVGAKATRGYDGMTVRQVNIGNKMVLKPVQVDDFVITGFQEMESVPYEDRRENQRLTRAHMTKLGPRVECPVIVRKAP